jgi:hypothetical protein
VPVFTRQQPATPDDPAAANGEDTPQGPPAPDNETRTGGAGGKPPTHEPAPANGEDAPQGPPAPDNETRTVGAGGKPPTHEPAPANGEDAPQGPPAPDNETRTGGAGRNTTAEGEAEADEAPQGPAAEAGRKPRHPRGALRGALRWALTTLAATLIYLCLHMPNTLGNLHPREFTRLPAEAILGAALLLTLPRRPRRAVAALFGAVLGALTVLNISDMGFNEYLGRQFNVILDWELLDDAHSYLQDSLGAGATLALTLTTVVLVVALITVIALSAVRVADLLAAHRPRAAKGTLVAGVVWITCSALGLEVAGVPVASEHTAGILKVQARRVRDTLRDEAAFAKEARSDTFGATPGDQLLTHLRGKDVVFTFIESYGRSAIEDPIMAPGVNRTLAATTESLAKAGFHARSGWLTSATYGGSSWLGHSTTLSGLWIDNQQRYRTVMAGDHLSLTKAFKKTGAWNTVGVMPGIQKAWPEQEFYGLDKVYNAFQLGYKGPKFSWSTMPDQYALEAFQRQVHGKKHAKDHDKPLMSEIILTSSHQPWAPIPKLVDWDDLGDGSVFKDIQKAGTRPADIITDTTRSRQEYGKSIQYSVTSLTQWLQRYGTDDTVLVFLGDHQPIARVSGDHASRDVPISIVAKDPEVLDRIADWNWTDGLRPARNAPVWKMSSFRDRFLTAYGSTPYPRRG